MTGTKSYPSQYEAIDPWDERLRPTPDHIVQTNELVHDILKPSEIVETVLEMTGVDYNELRSFQCRNPVVLRARESIVGLLRVFTALSYPDMTSIVGATEYHSTLHGAAMRFDARDPREVADLQNEVRTRIYRKRREAADPLSNWWSEMDQVKQEQRDKRSGAARRRLAGKEGAA